MMDETQTAKDPLPRIEPRSPAQHLAGACAAASSPTSATVRELQFLAQVELRVNEEDEEAAARMAGEFLGCELPAPGRVTGRGSPYALWCGPGWYLIVDSNATGRGLHTALSTALGGEYGSLCGSVVDVSAQRAILELSGPAARDVLAHGCTLDLHPRVFVPGNYAQTSLAKATVGIHQTAETDDGPVYRLLVRSSFTDYLVRWLLDATEWCTPGD